MITVIAQSMRFSCVNHSNPLPFLIKLDHTQEAHHFILIYGGIVIGHWILALFTLFKTFLFSIFAWNII